METKKRGIGIRRKKSCPFCADKRLVIDYKNAELLGEFISERGKILPKRMTNVCALHQRSLSTAIKRARYMALLPYVRD